MIFEEDKAFARAMLGDDAVNAAEENAVLVHHGIKGMKWGQWNAETRARRLGRVGKKARIKKDRKRAARNVQMLDDKELKDRIERLKNEKTLKDLTEEQLSPGRRAFKKALKTTGGVVLGAALTGAALYTAAQIFGNVKKEKVKPKNETNPNHYTYKYSFDKKNFKDNYNVFEGLSTYMTKTLKKSK